MSASATVFVKRNTVEAPFCIGPAVAPGLAGRTVVLPHESNEDYEALKAAFQTEYDPATDVEQHLLARMTACWWKLLRASRVQADLFEQLRQTITSRHPDSAGDAAIAAMFGETSEIQKFHLFMRYFNRALNNWNTISAEYQQTRKGRLDRDRENAMFEALLNARHVDYEDEDESEQEAEDAAIRRDAKGEPVLKRPARQQSTAARPARLPAAVPQADRGFVSFHAFVPEPKRPSPGVPRSRKIQRVHNPSTRP